jgi:cytochrome b561
MNDWTSFDTAKRIAARDNATNYDNVAIALHWATAVLVLIQFALAVTWDYFSRETRQGLEGLHVSFGVLLAAVIAVRIIWRLIPAHRRPAIVSGWVKLASQTVYYLLYALLVAQAGLGFAFRWAQGHTVSFFGLFSIPGPYGALERSTRHILHDLHEKAGWAIVIIAFGHALAALYHHYVLKDRVLERMLPPARP